MDLQDGMALSKTCGKPAKINSIPMLSQMAQALPMEEEHLADLICLTLLTRTIRLVTMGPDTAVEVGIEVVVVAIITVVPVEVDMEALDRVISLLLVTLVFLTVSRPPVAA
jgi:ABC-type enterobactin transport system permease subunit